MTERKTVNMQVDVHEEAQVKAWEDGRITVGKWIREAVLYYSREVAPKVRERFRAKLEETDV